MGQDLRDICENAGLKQIVKEPTRKKNLLDLVLTTMPESARVSVLSSISDHRAVLCVASLEVPQCIEVEREVWNYRDANWEGLKKAFQTTDWKAFEKDSVDFNAEALTNHILEKAREFIPRRSIKDKKMSHPWITEKCREATEKKNEIEKKMLEAICSDEQKSTEELEKVLKDSIRRK